MALWKTDRFMTFLIPDLIQLHKSHGLETINVTLFFYEND